MRFLRIFLSFLLALLIMLDAVVLARLATYGWPRALSIETVDGVTHAEVHTLSMSAWNWAVLALYLTIHVVLFYFVWRAWSQWRHRQAPAGR